MRKSRFLKIVLVIILLLVTLVGCQKNNCNLQISNTEQYVTVYTEKECEVNLSIVVKNGKTTDTISRKFRFTGDRIRNLRIEDFSEKYNYKGAIIIDAYCEQEKYSYEELHKKASIFTFLLGVSIATPATIFILKDSKKTKTK